MMSGQIKITAGTVKVLAELNTTKTADAIWKALPVTSKANIWGDEVYFSIPVKVELEDGKEIVNAGDLGYWPPGTAFCIFFGPTPESRGNEIRPASAVNVFGKIKGDAKVFRGVGDGEEIKIEIVTPLP